MEPDQEPHRTESKKEEEVNDERAARRNKCEAQKVKAEKADTAGEPKTRKQPPIQLAHAHGAGVGMAQVQVRRVIQPQEKNRL